jgi:hypothetical protein
MHRFAVLNPRNEHAARLEGLDEACRLQLALRDRDDGDPAFCRPDGGGRSTPSDRSDLLNDIMPNKYMFFALIIDWRVKQRNYLAAQT